MTTPTPAELAARLRAAGCVFAEEEAALLLEAGGGEGLIARRIAGEPLEQVLGWAEFCGLRVAVAPGVFVPRRRTALLVATAAAGLREGDTALDLGCGTGAIAAALLAAVPGLEVLAVDLDPAAVAVARRNLPPERVLEGDLYAPLPDHLRGRVAAVVANAPYVPSEEVALMPREAREHEHLVALDGGADGLEVQRRVVGEAPDWLAPGGRVLVETGRRQVEATLASLDAAGLGGRVVADDESGGCVVVSDPR